MNWKLRLTFVVKLISIPGSLIFISHRVWHEYQQGVLSEAFLRISKHWPFLLSLVFLLMALNWYLESKKWQILLKPVYPLGLSSSIKSVFAGITVSIFTPNRIGEFVGRVILLPDEKRGAATFANLLGNLTQLLITLLFGLATFPIFILALPTDFKFHPGIIYSITILLVVSGFGFVFSLQRILSVVSQKKWFNSFKKYLVFMNEYHGRHLYKVIFLSCLRFLVFGCQFFILIKLFEVPISDVDAIIGICQFYFLMAIVPTFAFLELGVRGSVSILVFSLFTPYTLGVMAASILLWFNNLALPAMFGILFLSELKRESALKTEPGDES